MKVVIEMPMGTRIKYEHDKENNVLRVDRTLSISVPHNYGYIKDSLSGDGDPTDAFVISDARLTPLCELDFVPKYLIKAIDNGEEDNKYVGQIKQDFKLTDQEWKDNLQEIKDYLSNYKKGFDIQEIIEL